MSRVLLIDNEVKSTDEIQKTILSLDPQCAIELFDSLSAFEEKAKEAAADYFLFNLVIIEYQLAKWNEWEKRIAELRSKLPPEAVICFTSYDSASVNRKHILHLSVFNLLYKPYDPLILKESLNMALKTSLNSAVEIKPVEIKPQPSKAFVGILKELDILSLSELGFVTQNDAQIPLYTFSKYYSRLFSHEKKQSVWAQCIQSEPDPQNTNLFISRFHFVGIDSPVLMKLRKHIQDNKTQKVKQTVWSFTDSAKHRPVMIAVIENAETLPTLKVDIEKNFKNVTVDILKYEPEKMKTPFSVPYDCVINLNPHLSPEALKPLFKSDITPLLVSSQSVTDDQFKEWLPFYRDILRLPLDRGYFYKKLKIHIPDLQFNEASEIVTISTSEKLKAANLVKLSEICELYLIFSYHREMPRQSYREFAFVAEDENQMMQFPAFCSFAKKGTAEPRQKAAGFTHQFTFWGMTDHFLKEIRIWLLHNYIEQNKSDSN